MARKIDTDAEIDRIRMSMQFSHPSNPDSGYDWLYVVSGSAHGGLYLKDPSGRQIGPFITGTSSAAAGIPSDGWIDKTAETWTYASADDPTFTFTITGDLTNTYQAGQRIKLTQTTVKYFIITKVEHAGGTTTITVYGGTDYDLANAAITNNYYSPVKVPFGFPLSPVKWSVSVTDTTLRSQSSPTTDVWYNLGSVSITIPIGVWEVSYQVLGVVASTNARIYTTLSTANNSESDAQFTGKQGAPTTVFGQISRAKLLTLTTKTAYYINTKTDQGSVSDIYNDNATSPLLLSATIAYL